MIVRCEDCGWFVGYVSETKCTTCRVIANHKLGLHEKNRPTACQLCKDIPVLKPITSKTVKLDREVWT